jgi:hypothetical protein
MSGSIEGDFESFWINQLSTILLSVFGVQNFQN